MVKIVSFEAENVKRIKAVEINPNDKGLTIIGGRNGQGKTSVLDSIAWALGGNKLKPSNPKRVGSVIDPVINITLSNGLKVERKGANSTLKVTDLNGQKQGQKLLDSFIEELAINLPKFMDSSNSEKAKILLNIIGVGDELVELEKKEKELYDERYAIGQIANQKKKFAEEQVFYEDAPKEYISASKLIEEQQAILLRNAENKKKRDEVVNLNAKQEFLSQQIRELEEKLEKSRTEYDQVITDLEIASTSIKDLKDEQTTELEENLKNIEKINHKVTANKSRKQAENDAKEYKSKYDLLTTKIDDVRQKKLDLLKYADLPLPYLEVEKGVLLYKGQEWDNMSGSEQLKVATAIVRKLKPECHFVLMDKLEQMDSETLEEFNEWLIKEDLQVIATKVSTGDECSIIIEGGYVKEIKKGESNNFNWTGGFK